MCCQNTPSALLLFPNRTDWGGLISSQVRWGLNPLHSSSPLELGMSIRVWVPDSMGPGTGTIFYPWVPPIPDPKWDRYRVDIFSHLWATRRVPGFKQGFLFRGWDGLRFCLVDWNVCVSVNVYALFIYLLFCLARWMLNCFNNIRVMFFN
jgi:hypothetical protein